MKTMIVLRSGMSRFSCVQKPSCLFSAEEIDQMDEEMFAGKDRDQLLVLRQKLSDSFEWLDSGDCGIGSSEMQAWERRLDKLNDMMDAVDGILNPEEDWNEEDQ